TLHFPQHDGCTIIGAYLFQSGLDQRLGFLIYGGLIRTPSWIRQPILGTWRLGPGRFQRDLFGSMPHEPAALVSRLVHGDAVNPGLQRALSAKAIHLAKNLQKDFL